MIYILKLLKAMRSYYHRSQIKVSGLIFELSINERSLSSGGKCNRLFIDKVFIQRKENFGNVMGENKE